LLENGYREIVLTAVHLGRYGFDLPSKPSLSGLIELLAEFDGAFRIRLSSIEPKEITPEIVSLVAEEEKLCPHLHIPLQSGSDRVLKKMNRAYTYDEYRTIVKDVRFYRPDVSISTDIMVGFPGETDRDFIKTCRAVEELGFSKVHIFPYSRRNGTVAIRYPSLPGEEIKARIGHLKKISDREAFKYRERLIGQQAEVLLEKEEEKGGYSGFAEHYVKVKVPEGGCLSRAICRVSLTDHTADGLQGKII
jgi:threonylcarbamoyladenosine tRNA methylthiotransferase MtaB